MDGLAPFELFGRAHQVTLAVIAVVSITVPLWARGIDVERARRLGISLAVLLVVYRTAYVPFAALVYDAPWLEQLPFHICGILFYICALALWTRNQLAYEISYFWGMGGTLQSLLTPEVQRTFPDPGFISHFLSHGMLMLGILYCTLALRMRPWPLSILRALAATLAYAAILMPVNLLLGTNYMYLIRKPPAASLLDFLGPWPWYILVAVGVALVSYAFWYLPFLVTDALRRRSRRRAGYSPRSNEG